MSLKEDDLRSDLKSWLSNVKKLVIIGVGNPLKMDDFIGIYIARRLKNKVPSRVHLVECETVPESFIEPIQNLKPTHILIIDAALLNLPPGNAKMVKPEETAGIPISTHALPLSIFCEYLEKTTGAKIALLAIQPKEIGFGEGLTEELEKAAEHLEVFLLELLATI